MGNRKNIIIVIVGIALLLIGFAAGYYYYSVSKSVDSEKTTSCLSRLTAEDLAVTRLWTSFENTTYNYTFNYPSDLVVQEENNNSVTLSSNTALFSLQFGTKDQIESDDFEVLSEENVRVACEKTKKVSLTGGPGGGENFRKISTQFTKDETIYVIVLTHRFVDEATSSDLIKSYGLLLKTVEFE